MKAKEFIKKYWWLLLLLALAIIGALYYFLIYKPAHSAAGEGDTTKTCPDGSVIPITATCTTAAPTVTPRNLTAINVQEVINRYAIKDSVGNPTLNYNGGFDNPNLSTFPQEVLINLLQDGWWFALINDGGNYKKGANGYYLLSYYDMRATIKDPTKGGVAIPVNLLAYKVI